MNCHSLTTSLLPVFWVPAERLSEASVSRLWKKVFGGSWELVDSWRWPHGMSILQCFQVGQLKMLASLSHGGSAVTQKPQDRREQDGGLGFRKALAGQALKGPKGLGGTASAPLGLSKPLSLQQQQGFRDLSPRSWEESKCPLDLHCSESKMRGQIVAMELSESPTVKIHGLVFPLCCC